MNKTTTERVWFTIPIPDLIARINIPNMKAAYLEELAVINKHAMDEAVLALAREEIQKRNTDVAAIAIILANRKTDEQMEFLLLVGGAEKELEKVAGFEKPFEWRSNPLEHEEPSQYERIRESAFNLLRKEGASELSSDAIWNAVKGSRHAGLYFDLLRHEIESGLTIKKLYARNRESGLER